MQHTERSLTQLLRQRYAPPEWAFMHQVRESTGFASRSADALAMSLWPSRGLHLHGFEIKVSRSDWRRELKDPAKAEVIAGMCDYWWIVAPKEVVKKEEIPATWGLIEATEKTLRVAVRASQITRNDGLMSREFLAAILRRAQEQITDDAKLQEEYRRGQREGEEHEREVYARMIKKEREAFATFRHRVRNFESISGIRIDDWHHGDVGAAVRFVLSGGLRQRISQLEGARCALRESADQVDSIINIVKGINLEIPPLVDPTVV